MKIKCFAFTPDPEQLKLVEDALSTLPPASEDPYGMNSLVLRLLADNLLSSRIDDLNSPYARVDIIYEDEDQ